nr:hypothetical protein [Cyanidiaceae sp.]
MSNALQKYKTLKILNFLKFTDPIYIDNSLDFSLLKLIKCRNKFIAKLNKNKKNEKYIHPWLIFHIYYHMYLRITKNQTKH